MSASKSTIDHLVSRNGASISLEETRRRTDMENISMILESNNGFDYSTSSTCLIR
jgi:hypothetical protein